MRLNSFILFILSSFLTSCSVYQATTPVPTAFRDKNEINISGSIAGSGAFSNIAYSPIKYVFVHAEGGASPFQTRFTYNYSGGPGFYYPLSPKLQVETQLSIGKGAFDWSDSFSGSSDSFTEGEGDYTHWNGSVSLNYKYNDIFSCGLTFRTNEFTVNYNKTSINSLNKTSHDINQSGVHLFLMSNQTASKTNFFVSTGLEFNNADYDYYPSKSALYTRVGLLFKLNDN